MGNEPQRTTEGTFHTDVLVIGAGLAGLSAAITALRAGVRVVLASSGTLCSGSSFSPATWGLGMVTPGAAGQQSLARAIAEVGCGRNDQQVTAALCQNAESSIDFLESLGPTLETPDNPGQREFIPCFDSVARSWHGFRSKLWLNAFNNALEPHMGAGRLLVVEHAAALSLLQDGHGAVRGCLLWTPAGPVTALACQTIIATGGFAGLWGGHLCAPQNRGACHVLAQDAGASLTNVDCMQLMLGFRANGRVCVHNEKVFRWTHLVDGQTGASIFAEMGIDEDLAAHALALHATHGPYTTRLPSRLVEKTIAGFHVKHQDRAVMARLDPAFLAQPNKPEFVQTYFAWLKQETGLNPEDPLPVGQFAHSCNGGIAIDPCARTSVPCLLACGEAAGGVHGQDRIGGLASTAAVTFGRIAGATAAQAAAAAATGASNDLHLATPLPLCARHDAAETAARVGALLDQYCMVNRAPDQLRIALEDLGRMQSAGPSTSDPREEIRLLASQDGAALASTHQADLAVRMAQLVVRANLAAAADR